MNEKEVSEIRKRFRSEKNNISSIRGCYVNDKGEIISEFTHSLSLQPEDESEKLLSILKKTLSGTLHKNLINIEFSTQQVTQGEEHKLLMALRDSQIKDEEAVHAFFQQVIETVSLEDSYIILLTHDIYDVPYRSKDGETQEDASTDVFSYLLCSICPIKPSKPALSYYVNKSEFHSCGTDWILSPPELGFMFPSFDDRSSNIYNALYYTRDTTQSYQEFVDAIFSSSIPMPAATQKEAFQEILSTALTDDCSLDIVQVVHGQLQQMIAFHKESKEPEPLTISKGTVKKILQAQGTSEEKLSVFDKEFDYQFGTETNISPKNIVDTKRMELKMPEVTIHVTTGNDNLVETRIIDGTKYVLIRAEEGVEINGVPIHIS